MEKTIFEKVKMKFIEENRNTVRCNFCFRELPRCPMAIFAHDHNDLFQKCANDVGMIFYKPDFLYEKITDIKVLW